MAFFRLKIIRQLSREFNEFLRCVVCPHYLFLCHLYPYYDPNVEIAFKKLS